MVPVIKQTGESVKTVYRELFMIKFLHAGYENPFENFLQQAMAIMPDEKTRQLFIDHRISYRFYTNTLTCFIECALYNPPAPEPKVPFIPLNGDLHVRFLVTASEDFTRTTYVVAAGSRHVYDFTNKISNTGGGIVFLTSPVENHSLGGDYEIGTLVQSGGHLFTCIKTALAADSVAISDTTFWRQLDPVAQVVNDADLKDVATVAPDTNCLAVIDMFRNGTVDSSYRLFDTSDQLFKPAPLFTIQFKSRL